jgi:Uma2 family endonuclease
MPQTLAVPATSEESSEWLPPRRKRWTRAECEKLVESGLLKPGRFELLEGEILFKMGQKPPHVLCVTLVLQVLFNIFGFEYIQSQAPVALNDENEPEPDAAVLENPLRDYLDSGTPTPEQVRLLVEVSDTTLSEDRRLKARLYAAAGIVEYWIVDVSGRRLLVHRQPTADGYLDVVSYNDNETLAPLAAPQAIVPVSALLP